MSEFTIRNAQLNDVDKILALHFAGLKETQSLSLDTSLDADLYDFAAHYPADQARFLLAVSASDEIMGMGAIRKIAGHEYEIKRMRVASAHRRKGIAQAILDQLFEFVANMPGESALILDTAKTQSGAQRLYEKNGFIRYSETMIGNDIPSFLYRKIITHP
ncbi:GNAT family N-acetyltransferase [Erwinia sp. V71]|uniref:GNAT family N-acetyltransferase n=1 Tax=Erwinia sp. V71 TaxID=3369424 RepID=UPI003F60B60F